MIRAERIIGERFGIYASPVTDRRARFLCGDLARSLPRGAIAVKFVLESRACCTGTSTMKDFPWPRSMI